MILRLAIDQKLVPETAHERVRGVLPAKGGRTGTVGGEQQIVEEKNGFMMHGAKVVRVTRVDAQVAVEAEFLLDIFAVVRVVPVDPGIGKVDAVLKAVAWIHGGLCDARHAIVPVVEPNAVPVNRSREVELVREIDRDRRVLCDANERTGILTVETKHRHGLVIDHACDDTGLEIECSTVWQGENFAWSCERWSWSVSCFRSVGSDRWAKVRHAWHHFHERMGRRRNPGRRLDSAITHETGERQEVFRLHPHARRDAPKHESSLVAREIEPVFGRDEDQEFVESYPSQTSGAVLHGPEIDHRPEEWRRGPGDVVSVIAER